MAGGRSPHGPPASTEGGIGRIAEETAGGLILPELPDVTIYCEAIERQCAGQRLERVRLLSPFLLRSVDPPVSAIEGRVLRSAFRMGKRVVLDFGDQLFAVLHLMIAGRLRWRPAAAQPPGKVGLATFEFSNGILVMTEASSKKRASLHVVQGEDELHALDPGGLEPLEAGLEAFRAALQRENHTLKRALTDPAILSGIGNAYSDEILHRARLSPFLQTQRLGADQLGRLHKAMQETLRDWTRRLRAEVGQGFPEKVTAFREGMAVHGRYQQPCPDCGGPVQRIVYAENEANYCPACQTEGRLLADRALSRLLREDWPRSLDEMERHKAQRRSGATGP